MLNQTFKELLIVELAKKLDVMRNQPADALNSRMYVDAIAELVAMDRFDLAEQKVDEAIDYFESHGSVKSIVFAECLVFLEVIGSEAITREETRGFATRSGTLHIGKTDSRVSVTQHRVTSPFIAPAAPERPSSAKGSRIIVGASGVMFLFGSLFFGVQAFKGEHSGSFLVGACLMLLMAILLFVIALVGDKRRVESVANSVMRSIVHQILSRF